MENTHPTKKKKLEEEKKLFCIALDIENRDDFRRIVLETKQYCDVFKVGPISFSSLGFFPLEFLSDIEKDIFLDFKFFDIPSVVKRTIRNFLNFKVKFITVHLLGGEKMVKTACDTAKSKGAEIVGVTILTSSADDTERERIIELARNSVSWGVNWIVASARFVPEIKQNFGRKIKVVSPGIRIRDGISSDDHISTFTPYEAVKLGSDMIVVGRPVVNSKNPALTAKKIMEDIEKAENTL